MFGEQYRDTVRIENPCVWRNHMYRVEWGASTMAAHLVIRVRELSPLYLNLWCVQERQVPKWHTTRFQVVDVKELSAKVLHLAQRVLSMESVIDETVRSIDASLGRIRATQAEIDRIKQGLQVD